MTEHRPTSIQPSRLLIVGAWIAGIASLGGFIAMILIAIAEIQTGRGLGTYRTHWLVADNWIGFLVFVVAAVVALVIALFMRHRERREIQQLQARYSGKHQG